MGVVEKPIVMIEEEDTDDIIENIRKQFGKWKTKESISKVGDKIVILLDKQDKKVESIVKGENEISYLDNNVQIKLTGHKKNDYKVVNLDNCSKIGMKVIDVLERKKTESN